MIPTLLVSRERPAKPLLETGANVHAHRLNKRFGDREVLRDIDLRIRPGEAVAIVGRSGCGKSTLLRLLAGLEAASEGTLHIDCAPLAGINRSACVMFQDATLLPWKRVGRNVELALLREPNRAQRAAEALSLVGLGDRLREWPARLSGGQRQRVALARALAAHRPLLLLDEPLSALDALTRLEMQGLIEKVWQHAGFSLALVTHDVEEAVALADRVLVMEAGRWKLELVVDLPRPRDRTSVRFNQLKERLYKAVLEPSAHQP